MKKRYEKRAALSVLTAVFLLAGAFTGLAAELRLDPGTGYIPQELFMDEVRFSMINASYWTDFPGADKVVMSQTDIQALNEDCLNNSDCNMNRLDAIEPVFNGIELRSKLAAFSDPGKLFLNGQPVNDAYYETLRAQIANAPVSASMPVGYAFCLERCVMRSIPCAEPLSDDASDPEWDQLALTAVLYNEPLVAYFTTANGQFTYVKSVLCDGWVPTAGIVLCHNKEEWMAACSPEHFLIVTGDKVQTEKSYNAAHSELTLEMGNRLELCYDAQQTVDNRMNWYNYVVYAPGRGADGLYEKQKMLIPAGSDVHIGYLPMTQEKIIEQAFKSLGARYGWGGSENAQDCSSFVREVYQCFGLCLPRNTTWQGAINTEKVNLGAMSVPEKKKALDGIPAGSILQFPGHEMLYLGTRNGKYYTINDVSSLAQDTEAGLKKMRVRTVVLNSLEDTKRANGKTWLEELTNAIVVFGKAKGNS